MKSVFWRMCVVSLLLVGGFILQVPESLGAISKKETKAEDLLISSFESDEDLARFEVSEGVKIERVTEHVTHGRYSLKVAFSGSPLPFLNTVDIPSIDLPLERLFYLRIKYPYYATRDFSGYEYLEMDVYHEGPGGKPNLDYPYFEHHVGRIDMRDSKGNWRPGWVPIIVYPYKNEGRVQLPLFSGPALMSEKNKFLFSDVDVIQITMPRPQKDWIVYIDDMRLVPPAPPINAYVKPAEPVSPASLEETARFKALSVFWIGEGRIDDLIKEYPTIKVLKENAVRLKIGIPESPEELKGYDIIILDNFPRERLSDAALNLIRDYYDKGGAVVMFGGNNSFAGDYGVRGYHNTPVEEILPVKLIRPGMYRQFLHYTHYVRLGIKEPGHPVMKGLPLMEGFRFVVPDGIQEPPAGYSRFMEAKQGTELLAFDESGDVPIIVTGQRSLIFNLEPRLRRHYFPSDFWERFIIQAFNYITKDKKRVGIDLSELKEEAQGSIPAKSLEIKPELSARAEDEAMVIGGSIPVLERDINFRVQGVHFFENDIFSLKKSLSVEDDTGLERSSELFTELSPCFLTWGERIGYPLSWENYIASLHNLYKSKVPFVLNSFNFWSGRIKYELIVNGLKRQIKLADEICGEYFIGIRLSEPEAIPWQYIRYREQDTSEGRAEAFSGIIRQLVRDVELPEDKLFILDVSTPIPYDWLYASGADVVGQACPVPITPVALSQSTLRGMSRSFNKWWEWEIVRWGLSDKPKVLLPYDPKTGRPVSQLQEVDTSFWQQDSRETYKMYVAAYYNGAKMINAFSENPLSGSSKEAILKFRDFAKANPRGKEVIAPVAVVRGKGCTAVLPVEPPFGMAVKKWERYHETEGDFLYLNLFFPGYSDDGTTTKYWWTGTPYGAIDVIYPEMKLEDLKKYNALVFLGYSRMDSVRGDFLKDLTEYVREGGVAVISVDQINNLNGRVDVKMMGRLLGVKIGSEKFDDLLKKKSVIKDYIETTGAGVFDFEKKRYPIMPQDQRHEAEEPWVYEISADGAKAAAVDGKGVPVLYLNGYGKGYILLFTVPSLSMIPPSGSSVFVRDIIDKAVRYRPLPIAIRPTDKDIQFLIDRTVEGEAVVFIMNHGEKDWKGEILINLKAAGLNKDIGKKVTARTGRGYEVKEITPKIVKDTDNLVISGIELTGDTADFTSYRQASFAVISLKR